MLQCPRCNCEKIYSIRRNKFRCSSCRCEFSETSTTALKGHKKPLGWYSNIIELRAAGLNAHQISMKLGLEYKSVWVFLRVWEATNGETVMG